MRFCALNDRPLHNDEGVNGNFLRDLVTNNHYRYDPDNYHGPSLYYLQLPFSWAAGFLAEPGHFHFRDGAGLTSSTLRIPPALVSLLLLVALFLAKRRIGPWGGLAAFLLAGFSCNLLFFSRYFIHEIYAVFFMVGIYLGLVYYQGTRRLLYFYLAAASAALLFCTKETSLFAFAVMGLSYVAAEFTHRFLSTAPVRRPSGPRGSTQLPSAKHWAGALGLCLLIWLLLYSSFFTNKHGLLDSFRAYVSWGKQGVNSGHIKPPLYFLNTLLIKYEFPLLVWAFLGLLAAFLKNDKNGLFLSYWALGIIAVYSIIPYKTPWCVINLIAPLALVAGYGIQSLIDHLRSDGPISRSAALGVVATGFFALILVQLPQTLRINYLEYDSDRYEMIYAHTLRDIYPLLDRIDDLAKKSGFGKTIPISVITPEYWPLPFYLQNYRSAAYWGGYKGPDELNARLIIAREDQRAQIDPLLKSSYTAESFSLRPGVSLELYVRNDLAGTRVATETVPKLMTSAVPPQNLEPGLLKRAYRGMRFEGVPIQIAKGMVDFDFWWDRDEQKAYTSPFSIVWSGYIQIESAGDYEFSTESDDGSFLSIDGTEVIDNGGAHAARKLARTVHLSSGFHQLEVRYFDVGGGSVMKFRWVPPDQTEEIVPKRVLFYSDDRSTR